MGQRKGWMVVLGVGSLAAAAFMGCSANGSADVASDLAPEEPSTPSASLPPASQPTSTPPTDAGAPAKDAGKKPKPSNPPADAGPPPPSPGDACTTPNQEFTRSCGACGTQSALCEASGKVSEYGPCEGETGECTPGTSKTEACGNCGTRTITCDQFCSWSAPACQGEPANACTPGGVELTSASCGKDLFRSRTCSESCQYPNFSDACSAPPTMVRVAPTPGQVNSTYVILRAGQVMPRLTGSCPNAAVSSFSPVNTAPYQYMTVRNPGTKAAKVTITTSQVQGGPNISTTLATYDGVVSPTDIASRKTCTKGFSYGPKLDGVVVAPGATITVFVGAPSNYDAANPNATTGRLDFSVSTDELL